MSEGTCLLCFSVTRVLDIKYTHLHYVYEELSDDAIQADSHPLCYICYAKLHQCEQMLKQIQENNSVSQPDLTPLVRLGMFNADSWSLPDNYVETELQPIIKEEYIIEVDVKINPDNCAAETNIKTEYIKEEHVENSPGHCEDETAVEPVEDKCTLTEPRTTQDDKKPYTCDPDVRPLVHLRTFHNDNWYLPNDCIEIELQPNIKEEYINDENVQSNPDDCADETDIKIEYIKEEHVVNSPGHCEDETAVEPVEDKHTPTEPRTIQNYSKPHTCDVCNKTFTRTSDIKRHKLIHKEEEGRLF